MGWQFTLAQFFGGPIIIVIVALLFRMVLRAKLVRDAAAKADKGVAGSVEGHAAVDMSVQRGGNFFRRLGRSPGTTRPGSTSFSSSSPRSWCGASCEPGAAP